MDKNVSRGAEQQPMARLMIRAPDLVADDVLDEAYRWLCRARRSWPASADVWSLRWRWAEERERIRAEILEERYRFAPLRRVTIQGGEEIDLWSARDALVLKCMALVLGSRLPLSRRCCHLKGHGGAKWAVREILTQLTQSRFVLKTDVRQYYASIDHHLLLERLQRLIGDRFVLNLLTQYLMRTSERGGIFYDYRRGIPLGAALSPVIGAFFLTELDRALERQGLFYLRFMDDVVVLAPSRWKLRRAVTALNRVLDLLGLEKHPGKTFIGRVERGFDFLGYRVTPAGLGIARQTASAFLERAIRLYEQEREEPSLGSSRLGAYVHRWLIWVEAGVPRLGFEGGPVAGSRSRDLSRVSEVCPRTLHPA